MFINVSTGTHTAHKSCALVYTHVHTQFCVLAEDGGPSIGPNTCVHSCLSPCLWACLRACPCTCLYTGRRWERQWASRCRLRSASTTTSTGLASARHTFDFSFPCGSSLSSPGRHNSVGKALELIKLISYPLLAGIELISYPLLAGIELISHPLSAAKPSPPTCRPTSTRCDSAEKWHVENQRHASASPTACLVRMCRLDSFSPPRQELANRARHVPNGCLNACLCACLHACLVWPAGPHQPHEVRLDGSMAEHARWQRCARAHQVLQAVRDEAYYTRLA